MGTKRRPEVGTHLLRTSILRAVADSVPALRGSDVVERFARSGWVMPPSVKDVRHAVRWLHGRGLVESRRAPNGPGKTLHLTHTGREAVEAAMEDGHGPLAGRGCGAILRASAAPVATRRVRRDVVQRTAGRNAFSVVRNSDAYARFLPCCLP